MTIYGRSEELVSRCVECDLAEPESLTSLGGSAPGVVDGIMSLPFSWVAVSPLQNKIGLSMGHTVANSQCLLRMSAGLLLPFSCNCFPDSMIGCQMVSFGDGGVGDGRAGNN